MRQSEQGYNNATVQALLEAEIVSDEQIETALKESRAAGVPIDQWLVETGQIDEAKMLSALSDYSGTPVFDLNDHTFDRQLVEHVDIRYAEKYRFLPISIENGDLTIAVSYLLDINTVDDLAMLLGFRIKTVLARQSDIMHHLRSSYGVGADTIQRIVTATPSRTRTDSPRPQIDISGPISDQASIIRFVNEILIETFRSRATDIHFEPYPDQLRIRYRVDGVLHTLPVPQNLHELHGEIVSRIKIMSRLNIAERRMPQDGRCRIRIKDTDIDLRVSILPSVHGETVNIRFLHQESIRSGLEHLGMDSDQLRIIENTIERPFGIMLVTGPTGSGKTTTLYACLNRINAVARKIITIEDPIEYQLDGITQIQVHPKVGLTFSNGLRAMLRHDPDVMMVGEVRDTETAQIAIRVSLTGHLVFSTVHTNNAVSTIARLVNMGIESYLIASSVECIVAQRLVRLICPECREEVPITPGVFDDIFKQDPTLERDTIFRGTGCPACKGTGYHGRTGVFEILNITDDFRDAIIAGRGASALKAQAKDTGMTSLRMAGLKKALAGITTLEEVLRVTQETE